MANKKMMKPEIDKIIHERTRLLILSYLAAGDAKVVPFTELKERLDLTAGNLSVQLRNLEEAGYIKINKRIVGRKPVTDIALTAAGIQALTGYLDEMETLINRVRNVSDMNGRG
jgi:DNA-binding transcriptional ArsR family regulator